MNRAGYIARLCWRCAILLAGIGVSLTAQAVAETVATDGETYRTIVLVSMIDCCENVAYPEAEQALVEELSLLGIPVIRVIGLATDDASQRQELETMAKQNKAAAAIRLTRPDNAGKADATL